MTFLYHDTFKQEIAALKKRRLRYIQESLTGFEKLCEFHFDPVSPQLRIAPGKLHRVTQNDSWTMWKTELPIINSGLRPNQYPRMWFVQSGAVVAFLCIASHIDNYNDAKMDIIATSRASDIF